MLAVICQHYQLCLSVLLMRKNALSGFRSSLVASDGVRDGSKIQIWPSAADTEVTVGFRRDWRQLLLNCKSDISHWITKEFMFWLQNLYFFIYYFLHTGKKNIWHTTKAEHSSDSARVRDCTKSNNKNKKNKIIKTIIKWILQVLIIVATKQTNKRIKWKRKK